MKLARRVAPGIRAKVLLASSALLLIPWIGYAFVEEMERFLREAQSRMLAENARAVATLVQERAQVIASDAAEERGVFDLTESIAAVLEGMARANLRIWIVDARGSVIMRTGSLQAPGEPDASVADPLAEAPIVQTTETVNALGGYPSLRAHGDDAGELRINAAAHPIVIGGETAGAALVEQSSASIASIRKLALERLLAATLGAFFFGALILVLYVTRISNRLRKLRDEAEQAIDSAGRVRELVAGSTARDEIGDLSRSYSAVLTRLGQYTEYLENLARRLNHELRTPIAVVRSSLDNLRGETLPADSTVYIDRADAGLSRLGAILSRMSEATRLEDIMGRAEREVFDLDEVAGGCAEGYRLAYAPLEIRYRSTGALRVRGVPDLIAQMLDKLVENAVEYAISGTPVEIELVDRGEHAAVIVRNEGPLLPAEMVGRLFDSMVTMPSAAPSGVPHLGLGLYVVKLIAQFHKGGASAVNRTDRPGVEVTVRLAKESVIPDAR